MRAKPAARRSTEQVERRRWRGSAEKVSSRRQARRKREAYYCKDPNPQQDPSGTQQRGASNIEMEGRHRRRAL